MITVSMIDVVGRVCGSLTVSSADLIEGNVTDGMSVVDGVPPGENYYCRGGVFVAMGEPPTPHHAFDYATKQWQDQRTLADHQVRKWAEIKALRDAAEFGPFTYAGHLYQGDVDAQRRLGVYISVSKSAIVAGVPFAAEWTTDANQQVLLSAADFVAIEMAKASQVAAAFAHAVTLRAAIHAQGATIESVEAVTW